LVRPRPARWTIPRPAHGRRTTGESQNGSDALSPEALANELAAAIPPLEAEEQPMALSLYPLLADAEPVSKQRLAEPAGESAEKVERLLSQWPGVYLDGHGCVVGFWGMALCDMPHRWLPPEEAR
jgi:hypothetical protein